MIACLVCLSFSPSSPTQTQISLPNVDFAALREEAMQKNDALQKSAAPVLKVIENPEVADRLKGAVDKQRNMELLQKEYNVSRRNRRSRA